MAEEPVEIEVLEQVEPEELKRLIAEDPWEAVIYLTRGGEVELARELAGRLRGETQGLSEKLKSVSEPPLTDGVFIRGSGCRRSLYCRRRRPAL